MKIKAGKYYRTRDGQMVGPMREAPKEWGFNDLWKWTSVDKKPDAFGFGIWCADGFSHSDPVIAEEVDLTAITTPFGLLDRETQEALKEHGGPYEMFGEWEWRHIASPAFSGGNTYRVIPAPPKPREWWVTGGNCIWDTYAEAYNACERGEKPIHVREVTE